MNAFPRDRSRPSTFSEAEAAYLELPGERRLARIATVGADGTPHVVPTGWRFDRQRQVIEVGGHDLTSTKKFRDVVRHDRVAIVVDDVRPPWLPRGVEVRGRAEPIAGARPLIRIHPDRVVSWGLEDAP
jgi:pyridoxamine 5'-phosphate oxidase family protein